MDIQPLKAVHEQALYAAVEGTDKDIVSAIGVIEHLREPERFFEAVKKSRAQYVYYSVPMFSLSALLENVMPAVFPRQLSGGHTHLFTEKPLNKMHELMGGVSIAEWRFGTDVMDLYRSMMVSASQNDVSEYTQDKLKDGLAAQIDELQAVLDTSHFCSEIHVLVSCAA